MTDLPWSQEVLRAAGSQRSFTGESLREIAFPLGGIGTGTISLGGRGQLRDWEIFNRPGKGKDLPYTFFAIYAEAEGAPGVARVLERRILPPYSGGFGLPTGRVSGLPRLHEAVFRGEYPFAWIDFLDAALPVQVSLEAFNPFIPMNDRDSGLPVVLFSWTLANSSGKPVSATIVCNLLNAVGYNGKDGLGGRHNKELGQNQNTWREEPDMEGIFMSGGKHAPDSPQFGTMALATEWPDTTVKIRWERAGWWDDAQNFWDEFTQGRGTLPGPRETDPSPDAQSDVGVLGLQVTLEPGQSTTLPFVLAWHFPNLTNTWNGPQQPVAGKRVGNWYATQWTDAWEVARYVIANRERLEAETRAYHKAMFDTTLPAVVVDAAASNASILRTATVLRTEDGRMNGFEGCSDNEGCCPMNCTHVWNYVWTVASLFPALERSVRLTDFQHNTRTNGDMAFRTLLPLIGELRNHPPAADGQMGTIMKAYREWLQSGDKAFLESLWPGIERALEFAWQPESWDADQDGVMEGQQHNTYDIEFYGPNTMCGLFYLGALRAAEEMATVLGHKEKAAKYRDVFEKGSKKYSELLWNGEFFKQIVNVDLWDERHGPKSMAKRPDYICYDTEPRYQYGPGCISDMLLGQWFAMNMGLGYLLPAEQVKSAISAIFKYNWKADLSAHATVQRVYALNDEAGLLLCSWPKGGRPQYPFPYADEVWTGIEYQVAAHLMHEGLVDEGLAIVKGVRDRYEGAKRNPWDEVECGHHYARAMSSWSLIVALSGYHYDASRQHLAFAPKISQDDLRSFFSAGSGWGTFSQKREIGNYTARIELVWGQLALQTVKLPLDTDTKPAALVNNQPVEVQVLPEGVLKFASPVRLQAGQSLEVKASR